MNEFKSVLWPYDWWVLTTSPLLLCIACRRRIGSKRSSASKIAAISSNYDRILYGTWPDSWGLPSSSVMNPFVRLSQLPWKPAPTSTRLRCAWAIGDVSFVRIYPRHQRVHNLRVVRSGSFWLAGLKKL